MRWVIVFAVYGLISLAAGPAAKAQEAEWHAFADSGWRAARQGDQKGAKELLEKARQISEKFPAEDPRRALTVAYLAYSAARRGDKAESSVLAKQAADQFAPLPPETPNRGRGYLALALASVATGRHEAADSQLRKAIESEEKQRGPNHYVVLQLVETRASLLESQGRFEEAEPLRKRHVAALDITGDIERSTKAIASHRQTGLMYRRWNRGTLAAPHFERAVELCRGLRLPEAKLAEHLTELGEQYLLVKQLDKAGPPLQEALKLLEAQLGERPIVEQANLARTLHAIGSLYVAQGRFFPAEPVLERALSIREKAHGDDLRTAETLAVMAVGHTGQRSFRKAERELLRALQIRESLLGQGHLLVASTHEDLATIYLRANTPEAAESSLLRVIEIREKAAGPSHPSIASALHSLANLYRDQKKHAESESLFKRAVQAWEQVGSDNPGLAGTLDDYALLLKQLDKSTDADKLSARAASIRSRSQ